MFRTPSMADDAADHTARTMIVIRDRMGIGQRIIEDSTTQLWQSTKSLNHHKPTCSSQPSTNTRSPQAYNNRASILNGKHHEVSQDEGAAVLRLLSRR